MKNKYTGDDLRSRLDGTIIRYKGSPVYVRADNPNLILYTLPGIVSDARPFATVRYDDPELDVSTVPLGYVNTAKDAFYITREPYRRYKQGVDESSVRITSVDGSDLPRKSVRLYSQAVEDCILNKYPLMEECFVELRLGNAKSRAFSRDIALAIDKLGIIRVHYKATLVGWIAPGSNKVNVPSSELGWIISQNLGGFSWTID